MEKNKNDVFDLFEVEGGIAPEANLQLPDRELVADWKGYKSRSLYIFDDIDDRVMLHVKNIIQWNREDEEAGIPVEKRTPITLFINSYGGDVSVCYALVSAMRLSKTIVRTVNVSVACSAAGIILLSGTPRYRYCFPMSFCLLHQGSRTLGGTASQVESQQNNYKKMIKVMEEHILENTKIEPKEWTKIKTKENYYWPEQQVEKGIVDKICSSIDEVL